MKALIDVNPLLYEGMKKIAKEKNQKVGEIIEIAFIEYLAKQKSIFSEHEKSDFEKIKNRKE